MVISSNGVINSNILICKLLRLESFSKLIGTTLCLQITLYSCSFCLRFRRRNELFCMILDKWFCDWYRKDQSQCSATSRTFRRLRAWYGVSGQWCCLTDGRRRWSTRRTRVASIPSSPLKSRGEAMEGVVTEGTVAVVLGALTREAKTVGATRAVTLEADMVVV